ncbi:MAG: tRNA uridine-5-carboxymethylaminomethyl(34) synthesis GTPase MnmE [Bacteroidota bacterium]
MQHFDTIVAISTPPGVGALGLIRLSGPQAVSIVDRVFSKDLLSAAGYTVHYGELFQREPVSDATVAALDQVVVSIFRAPRSFTKEDVAEVSFHGSPFILREALKLFVALGARLAEPGEFTQRAFLNGAMDLAQAEAVADLIASASRAAHAVALQQLKGGVSKKIAALRAELLDFTSLIELELDFGEEDVEFADREKLLALVRHIRGLIARLAESFQFGNAMVHGVPTVIAGRPNAGKSTLLNALLQEERAIVSDIPGTTRDTIEETLVIEGVQFRIIDTAGLRDTDDAIESIGVARTREKIGQASIVVYLFDLLGTSYAEVEADLAPLATATARLIVVGNKADGLATDAAAAAQAHWAEHFPSDWLQISAQEGRGLNALRERLHTVAMGLSSGTSDVVISNVRHLQALEKAGQSLAEAEEGLGLGMTQELVALDIRHAVHYLGEITGEITTDEVLGNIFGKFCIGK